MAKTAQERQQQKNDHLQAMSVRGRDIAPLPAVVNPERRAASARNFRLFAETYFTAVFNLAWSDDHLRVIQIIEDATLTGGLFAVAMPRGSGKTSLAICAAIWSLLYGHRSFVVLIGASEDAATDLLENIKTELESNDLLNEDFPEVCYPIRKLDGLTLRAHGQHIDGTRTQIGWTAKELVLPTVTGSASSGARVKVAGITGRIRGLSVKRPSDGSTIRPDFVLVDDPQTDDSARSPKQVRDRLNTVNGAILGLAGPGKKIAGVMPVTVIAKGDMADQVLDRKSHPEWQGERIKLLRSEPTDTKLWEEYAEHRATGLREGRGLADATAFYVANQIALDAGAVASWPSRFNADERSAVQHAMNLKLRDAASFFAEYQNEPLSLDTETPLLLVPAQVAAKANNVPRGVVPADATKLTAFIDVQGTILFYTVCAWSPAFGGHVVDYGTYPDQPRSHFTLREVQKTLASVSSGATFEGYLYAGLESLTTRLLRKDWQREDAGTIRISRLMIDANWGDSTAVVKQFCRRSDFSALMIPSHGVGVTADRQPMNDWSVRPSERAGWNWRVSAEGHSRYDTNSWKTFVAQRLLLTPAEPGNLSIFSGTPTQHQMFCEHVTSEYPTPTEGMGRTVNVWRLRPNRENHYFDCLVGCAVAASEQGILAVGHDPAKGLITRKRRQVKASF